MGSRRRRPARKPGFTLRHTIVGGKSTEGLKIEQAKQMKELEKENVRLKRLVAELSLEKQVFKDVAERDF